MRMHQLAQDYVHLYGKIDCKFAQRLGKNCCIFIASFPSLAANVYGFVHWAVQMHGNRFQAGTKLFLLCEKLKLGMGTFVSVSKSCKTRLFRPTRSKRHCFSSYFFTTIFPRHTVRVFVTVVFISSKSQEFTQRFLIFNIMIILCNTSWWLFHQQQLHSA